MKLFRANLFEAKNHQLSGRARRSARAVAKQCASSQVRGVQIPERGRPRPQQRAYDERPQIFSRGLAIWALLRPGRARSEFNFKASRRHAFSHFAFTLIEVMISCALMALILISAYSCLSAGFSAQKMVEPRAEIIQNARVAMALMSADLRAACPLSKTDDFLGMSRTVGDMQADNLDFGTHNYTPRRAREGDFCQESIYLEKNPETGQFSLWRRHNPTIGLDPLSGGAMEELAQGVVGLKFEYFDGTDWYDTWGEVDPKKRDQSSGRQQNNLTGLPEAIRITLLMDSNPKKKQQDAQDATTEEENLEPPLVFQTVVRLNLADATQAAESAPSITSSDNSSTSGQTPDNGGNQ